jgi:hypothetical protein
MDRALLDMCATAMAVAERPMLLILAGEDCGKAIGEAFSYAKSASKRLHVTQILGSNLYHYGRHDLVATRPFKREFLLYIREEVLKRGKEEILALEELAGEMGVPLEVNSIESEDILSAALSEAKKGYDIIFLPRQKKKLFPLFERTLPRYLQKKISGRIVLC